MKVLDGKLETDTQAIGEPLLLRDEQIPNEEREIDVDECNSSDVVTISNGSFSWDLEGKSLTLSNISVNIPKGRKIWYEVWLEGTIVILAPKCTEMPSQLVKFFCRSISLETTAGISSNVSVQKKQWC